MLRNIGFFIIYLLIVIVHFLVTFVVVLFVLSTLNIVNQSILHLEKIDYIEIIVSAVILVISVRLFFSSFNKISRFIKITIFKDP